MVLVQADVGSPDPTYVAYMSENLRDLRIKGSREQGARWGRWFFQVCRRIRLPVGGGGSTLVRRGDGDLPFGFWGTAGCVAKSDDD